MGLLWIKATGSFPAMEKEFSALQHGHAVAVDDAVKFLLVLKEKSRLQDLALRQDGHTPIDGFKEADIRGVLKEPA